MRRSDAEIVEAAAALVLNMEGELDFLHIALMQAQVNALLWTVGKQELREEPPTTAECFAALVTRYRHAKAQTN